MMRETEITHNPGEGLRHDFQIRVPAERLSSKLDTRISEMLPRMNLRGFRPGKVPAAHIKRIYGDSLMDEIINEVMQESAEKAFADAGFKPAVQPEIEVTASRDELKRGDCDLEYQMSVEAMPEFTAMDPVKIELSRPKLEITDQEMQEMLARIAEANKQFQSRPERKAQSGDMVVIDFSGSIDGKEFEGGSASDQQIVIGSGRMIPGFEEALIGAVAGEQRQAQICFPEDYPETSLRGAEAVFELGVKDVREPETPKLDDELARNMGMEDLRKLEEALRQSARSDYDTRIRAVLKRRLFDVLDKAHDFALPEKMVQSDLDELMARSESNDETKDGQGKSREDYLPEAQRRIRLGMVLSSIGRAADIEIRPEEVKRAIAAEASRYPEHQQEAMRSIQGDRGAVAGIRAHLFEEKVLDYILEQAQITDQPMTNAEFAKLEQDILSE